MEQEETREAERRNKTSPRKRVSSHTAGESKHEKVGSSPSKATEPREEGASAR